MRKILTSLLAISVLSLVVIFGTKAYFSDTETSVGNTITAGTIDIAVDSQNPWDETFTEQLTDIKPGSVYAKDLTFTIQNVGNNPANIWKKVTVTAQTTGTETEPECSDQGGVWTNPSGPCTWGATLDNNDMASEMHYGMTVGTVNLIPLSYDVMMSDVDGLWIPVATLQPNETMTINQDYYLDEMVGNWAQGDQLTFDITLYAEQYMGTGPAYSTPDPYGVVLENKSGDPYWTSVIDGTWAMLTWDVAGNYTMKAWGLNPANTYRVAYWNGSSEAGVSTYQAPNASGELTITGVYAAFNTNPAGAKYWLRPNDWSSANTLWEANLVD